MSFRDREPGQFGYFAPWRCACCGPIDGPEYLIIHRATRFQPEEGEEVCSECGRSMVWERADKPEFTVIQRRKIHPMRGAA